MMLRAKYEKLKGVRYISHLELMKTLRQAMRRAGLPAAYSRGYNPHINLSLSQPLPVGMTGREEYFDVELKETIADEEFVCRLNRFLTDAIRIKDSCQISETVDSLQAVITRARYLFKMEFSDEIEEQAVCEEFMSLPQIKIIRHRRNKKNRELDLKPMIHDAKVVKSGYWQFTVSTGSRGNVRPSEVSRALAERYEKIEEIPLINIERLGLFVDIDDKLYSPFSEKVVREMS